MKPIFSLFCVLMMLSLCRLSMAVTVDSQAEAQIAEQLGLIQNTELLQLQAGNSAFPALFSPAVGAEAKGVVVLLNDMGQHLNWPAVISLLREGLPEFGWATLSLQMPLLPASLDQRAYGQTIELAAQRLQAGVDYLGTAEFTNLVVVGHGLGAASALWYIGQQQTTPIVAVAGVSVADGQWLSPSLDLSEALGKIQIPLLDLYAANDRSLVLNALAARRISALKNPQSRYRQMMIPGAGSDYIGYETLLLKRIRSWLSVVAPSEAASNKTAK